MSKVIQILMFEEGYKEDPYLDTEGYPTIGCGIKIGPKGAALENYIFTLPSNVGSVWMQMILNRKIDEMSRHQAILAALRRCNTPRTDVLYSMAYQLGVDGLSAFKNALMKIAAGDFNAAADAMLNSLWAQQTPQRARRHADVMRSGTYTRYQEVL
ncbi:glycoside hydrolase family protein [Erwinia sorbitola]|uniref:Lysozyme n=1 Tax=Erwinia sorbitola TaxID=2681984 RepID=A0A6I6ETX3_9GAMM|nr:lysozyme [Erwinia sorbitola]MTD25460.1 lysozyme [Erwinia sorbitola]QGU87972.1 lysozyme [Erwinia sorbitola]